MLIILIPCPEPLLDYYNIKQWVVNIGGLVHWADGHYGFKPTACQHGFEFTHIFCFYSRA